MQSMKKFCSFLSCLLCITFLSTGYRSAGNETLKDGYSIDTRKSSVKWTGKSVKGGHFGGIRVANGSFQYDGKAITAGTVTIDMNSITVDDLEEAGRKDRLAGHLKNDDFFATDKFPEAKLVITGSKPGAAGQLEISGNLTIKGITKPVTFPAAVKSQGKNLEATGVVTVDRALYDIKYRSKSVLDPSALADKLIYDEFTLEFKVVAAK